MVDKKILRRVYMEATLDRLLEVYARLDALEKGYDISPNNEKQSDIDYEIFSEEYLALYEKILNALKSKKNNIQES